MSSAYLAEISEADASGTVAAVYEDIRATMELPLVNLIYRHLAVEPGRLESIWQQLRPNIVHPTTAISIATFQSNRATGEVKIPASALAVVEPEGTFINRALTTIEAYNYANPRNLLCIYALLDGCPGTGGTEGAAAASKQSFSTESLLPMSDLNSLDRHTRVLLEDLSRHFASPGETVIVPSLFRHFADNAGLLALLFVAVLPVIENGTLADSVAAISRVAPALAQSLPFPVQPVTDESTRALLLRFTDIVPSMMVAGRVLQQALGSGPRA